ncbi:1,4-alpha-glucan branching protein GlgB [Schinkia azotoformans]|uniref:1,4-alpha-glucan branching enzyme GlgB n=1 Tax=Schinkia azotoformans LMG 9581 TaxID=1131731 RepID=K6DNT0_SCHAZ|nr:1,4-alpha-glucan branching protein GlgB [Schinkia azotoformans]EKN62416.1 glycogen branching enzyme [Schinkia azotoformans LMG 9581]MEC1640213.1 1,4-alpha-glucan branching protein GlgB [Schinkia azotoformans]MEC1945361.1 1,4-alpha-glucan branching protein GlgB [Schinkia azotoformans]
MVISHPTEYDAYLFHLGQLFQSYKTFGAHIGKEKGVLGVRFTVWAPHAEKISVIGDFNNWIGDHYHLEKLNEEGIWTNFFPKVSEGALYKYEITTADGRILRKSDPFAFYSEKRPHTASIIYNLSNYEWNDNTWFHHKKQHLSYNEPMFIYEVHLGTWKTKENGEFLSYRELADELIPYVVEAGYTHIELLPLVEHPFDRSWGYQGTGYYSVTSRYGSPHEFMEFVDKCHQHGIGVILDWVPGHFCKDAHGLYLFDGEPTFEYANPFVMQNDVWGTANFDLGKTEVQSFLISNAIFWMDVYHIDGLRVDAVANMLYWDMNGDGTIRENQYAVQFLRALNEQVFKYNPTALMIAEDSTEWPLVTAPTTTGGLGFNYKWNMGWMNDVLEYMELNPVYRKYHHNLLTFSLLYAYTENFVLPFSHDEVVHGKKSLLNKMPGDYWQKFAQLRLLYGYLMAHPGKKLVFMGGELGQFEEWKDLEQIDWFLLNYDMHNKIHAYTKKLLKFYKEERSLWELDLSWDGFQWIDPDNKEQSILSFMRKSKNKNDFLIIVCNFTPVVYQDFKVGVPLHASYVEVFSSDETEFGGTGQVNTGELISKKRNWHGQPYYISIKIPPFGISILRPTKKIRRIYQLGKSKFQNKFTSLTKGRRVNASKKMYCNASGWRARKPLKFTN